MNALFGFLIEIFSVSRGLEELGPLGELLQCVFFVYIEFCNVSKPEVIYILSLKTLFEDK